MIENRRRVSERVWRWLIPLAAVGTACDGQADPSYRGEPLMSVSGRVEAGLSVEEVEVGVLWLTSASEFALECTGVASANGEPSACAEACGEVTCETLEAWDDCVSRCPDVTFVTSDVRTPSVPFLTGGVGQTTPARGEFPARFSLEILEPPPDDVWIESSTGERLAIGLFVALDPNGAPFRIDLAALPEYPEWLLGGSESHLLLYAPDGLPEGSLWSQASGLTVAAGFHLVALSPPLEADQDPGLEVVPGGEASQISLRIAPPASITWPVLF